MIEEIQYHHQSLNWRRTNKLTLQIKHVPLF